MDRYKFWIVWIGIQGNFIITVINFTVVQKQFCNNKLLTCSGKKEAIKATIRFSLTWMSRKVVRPR